MKIGILGHNLSSFVIVLHRKIAFKQILNEITLQKNITFPAKL